MERGLLLMVYAVLMGFGAIFGSFVTALVWRLRQQEVTKGRTSLSITKGRSMCPTCRHALARYDLIPVFSWLWLKGRCRYCKRPIHWQYPAVELLTALLFIVSYRFWPYSLDSPIVSSFGATTGQAYLLSLDFMIWLLVLVGLIALLVYDLKWMRLPNKIIYPLIAIAASNAVVQILLSANYQLLPIILSVAVGGGIFYLLFQISGGRWIGGGDVKLGILFGLLLADPLQSLMVIFLASLLGTAVSLPLLISKKVNKSSPIPFGPFLIVSTVIMMLFGDKLVFFL